MATEELVDIVRVFQIHVNLREHREGSIVLAPSKLFDFRFGSRLLVTELIAGEGEDFETLVLELLMELNHFFVVLIGQASLGRNIDDHNTFLALEDGSEVGKINANNIFSSNFEEAGFGGSHKI